MATIKHMGSAYGWTLVGVDFFALIITKIDLLGHMQEFESALHIILLMLTIVFTTVKLIDYWIERFKNKKKPNGSID